MIDARDRSAVIAHSKRPTLPEGLDPMRLEVLERDGSDYILQTELARVDRYGITFLEMSLPNGVIYKR
jgi:hypothetical protein